MQAEDGLNTTVLTTGKIDDESDLAKKTIRCRRCRAVVMSYDGTQTLLRLFPLIGYADGATITGAHCAYIVAYAGRAWPGHRYP